MKLSLRRVLVLFAAMIFALATGMTAAQAVTDFNNAPNGAHYAKGASEPKCTVDAKTAIVTCTGTRIEGVGNTNADVKLDVTTTFTGVCHNPGNGNIVDPFTKSDTKSTSTTVVSSKNGRLIVGEQTTEGTSRDDFLATFECPNPNWTAELTDARLDFTYTLTFKGFQEPAITVTGSSPL